MKSNFSYFRSSIIFTVLAVIAGFFVAGPLGALECLMLGILETSLSFDNAVVNAGILRNWSEKWRKRFIVYGIPVAVFGMRLVFPLLIVAIIAGIGPIEVVKMAINNPDEYAKTLTSAHAQIAAFGGAFLALVAIKFFVDQNKDEHWFAVIEKPLTYLGRIESVEVAIVVLVVLLTSTLVGPDERMSYIHAGLWGIVAHIMASGLGSMMGGDGDESAARIIKEGIMGFLYLEMLDASFSFDGVIGAFAISHNILIIALGLGIGAMFVRSMTIMLVDKGVLSEYRYLEHGAFWAISALTVIMFVSVKYDIPNVITGTIGAGLIGLALLTSIIANKRDAANGVSEESEKDSDKD